MAIPLQISDAADLVDLSIQDLWLKGSEKNVFYDKYYNVDDTVTDLYTKDSSLSGLGYASRIVENAAVVAESPVQGFDKTYTQVEFGKLLGVTKMMWKFGIKKRKLQNITDELRKACVDLRELRCAERLDNAFSTSYTATDDSGNYSVPITGGDGSALITNSHTREDGGTAWSNRNTDGTTVNMDFELDALKAAHRTAALVTGPKGKPMNVNLDTLIVTRGFAVSQRAREILGAIKKNQISGSSDNDGAGVPEFKIIELPWIQTNTSYWFMMDSSMKNDMYGLQYKEAQPITLEGPNVVFKTGEIQYRASLIFDIGHNDARGWQGSKNTNAA